MKLEQLKVLDIERIGNSDTGIEAGITAESLPFVFEVISRQLYSNPIGSIVREITSNCFDSHQEAGVDDPVIIKKGYDTDEGYYIEFQDFGVGLSKERMETIYVNYFSSTKRNSNEQIGGFGLGSKTPLAYADLFYINTVHDGSKREYIFHKGENKPTLELLSEEETEERNGTIIKVVIESGDIIKFTVELRKQLLYFDNVYFEGWGVNNSYDIYEGEYFKFRSDIDQRHTQIHVCIGKVRYDLDFTKIKIPSDKIEMPIAVKFEIGELQITPSRESLRYNEESIALITQRIGLAIDEVFKIFEEQNPEIETLKEYDDLIGSQARIVFDISKNHTIELWTKSNISKDFKFKPLSGLKIKKNPKQLFFGWEHLGSISGGVYVPYKYDTRSINNKTILGKKYVILGKNDKISKYTDLNVPSSTYMVIRKKKFEDFSEFDKELGIKSDINKARTIYNYNKIIDSFVYEGASLYSSYRPTEEWINNYRKELREESLAFQRRKNKKVFFRDVYRNTGEEETEYELQRRTGILVYGFKEDKNILLEIANNVVNSKNYLSNAKNNNKMSYTEKRNKAFMVIQIAKAAEKSIVGAKKTIYFEDFLKTKFYQRIISSRWLLNRIDDITHRGDLNKIFIPNLVEDVESAKKLSKKYCKYFSNFGDYNSKKFYSEIKILPEFQKVGDDLINKYKNIVDLPFIRILNSSLESYKSDFKEYVQYLKYKKIRLRKEHYLKDKRQLEYEEGVRLILSICKGIVPKNQFLIINKNNENASSNQEESSSD